MADAALPTRDRVEGYFKELNNWGRWGHDDQLGTLNLITPAKQAQAQRLIKKGRTVSLARDVIPRPVYMYHMTFPSKRERVDVVLDRFDMVYHGFWITHVDALCHVGWDGELYNGRPFAESLSADGALWCPIDPIFEHGITTRGVLLDVAAGRKDGYVTVGHPVTPRELDVCVRLLRGMTYDGIASDLGLSVPSVKTYRNRAFDRLGIHFRNELFAIVLQAPATRH